MVSIICPVDAEQTVSCVEGNRFVTLTYENSSLDIPTLPRPGNYSETVFFTDGELGFIPGTPSVLAAHIAINPDGVVVTLFAIPVSNEVTQWA